MPDDTPNRKGDKKRVPSLPGYRLVKVLGKGAQGTVVEAVREYDGATVAVKFLTDADVEDYRARFTRESAVLLTIEHPNIVAAYDVGQAEGNPYIVMEYVQGETLLGRLKREALDPDQALPIIRQAAEGLKEIHANALVHRDIKPENLMITEDGTVKLMDLGLAKALESEDSLTVTGSVFGTPSFMSPEAARDSKDVDIRADIYSLGVSLYQALTRKVPFQAKTIGTMMKLILTKPVPPPSEHRDDIPEHIEALIMKMLAKDRADRQQDPDELLEDIDRVMEGKKPRAARKPAKPKKKGWWPFGRK